MAYCSPCNRYFPNDRALEQHEDDSSLHSICRPCGKDFSSPLGLEQHYVQSPRHAYCQYCEEHFSDTEDLLDHGEEHHLVCRSCEKVYSNLAKYRAHMNSSHWYCQSCDRPFQSESNLEAHENSSIHKPKHVNCPGINCNKTFVSHSALILHLESGTCPSRMTRGTLNERVVRMDRNNVITNPSRLIRGPEGYTSPSTNSMWATDLSWNGSGFECFLCHKVLRTLSSLNAHLQSPRHESDIYRCPNTSNCGVQFKTLSGLCQHVERGHCGVQRFREVKKAMDSLMSGVRKLTM